jgi:hypothetical protein
MKKLFIMIFSVFGLCLPLCSSDDNISEADKRWLLVPQELPDTLIAGYTPQKNSRGREYFYKKTKTSLSGFSGVFAQKLINAKKDLISFTVQVSYARSDIDARALYGNYLTIEEKNKKYVRKVDPKHFEADDAVLIQSDNLLYLTLRKNRIVYFVQIENCTVTAETIKTKIFEKIRFIENHASLFRT